MKRKIRRIVDIGMCILLMVLMGYQVTGGLYHEYAGVAMSVMCIVHIFLNRYWYPALFKGRYNAYRTIITLIDLSLLICFLVTALCGMAMSSYAVPFMYGIIPIGTARQLHMSLSYWSFILMGLHLGFHVPAIVSQYKLRYSTKRDLRIFLIAAGAYGFSTFIRNRIMEYLFFKTAFVFFDYSKSIFTVFIEIILMFSFFVLVGEELSSLTLMLPKKNERKKNLLYPALCIALAILIGLSIRAMME